MNAVFLANHDTDVVLCTTQAHSGNKCFLFCFILVFTCMYFVVIFYVYLYTV